MSADSVDSRWVLVVVLVVVLIETIGYSLLLPLAPLLLTESESAFFLLPDQYTVETGYILLGTLITLYPLGQFLSAPVMGQLSDRYGRRLLLSLSIVGSAIAHLLFAIGIITASIPLLLVSRLFDGITGGNIAVIQAVAADVSPAEKRSTYFGLIIAMFSVGFVIGPFLSGALSSPDVVPWFTSWTPFVFAAGLAMISLTIVSRFLPETSPMDREQGFNWRRTLRNVRDAFDMQHRRRLFGTSFFFSFGGAFFTSFISVFLIQHHGFDQFAVGNFYLYFGGLLFLTQVVVVPRFFDRFSESRTMPITLFLAGFFLLAAYLPEAAWLFLAITPLFTVSIGLTQVSLITLISNSGADQDQGLILGVNASLSSLGRSFPGFLSGIAAAFIAPESPVLIASIIIMATALAYAWLSRRST